MKTGHRPKRASSSAPLGTVGISRQQLLRGAAGSAAVGLLVTLPQQDASADVLPGARPPDSDFLWLVGPAIGSPVTTPRSSHRPAIR
jgi:hypothetical protein